MNEIIKIAVRNKIMNANNSRAIELLNKNYKSDKITGILKAEVPKLILGLIKLGRW